MQQNPRLNPHGVAGILFIVLMFGIAFFLNWNINWWYFVPAVVLYSWAVISLTRAEEQISEEEIPEERLSAEWLISRCLLACHLTLLFLAGGLLLHFQDYTYRPFFGDSAVISVGFLSVGYFISIRI